MASRVVKHYDFLSCLSKSNTKDRREHILNWALDKHIKAVCEIALNIRSGNVSLDPPIMKKLKYQKKLLKKLSLKNGNYTIQQKRELLKHSVKFIQLLPIILETIRHTLPDFQNKVCTDSSEKVIR